MPIIGTGMILWSGFTILTAGEKPDQVKKGRKMITATLIGIQFILLTSWLRLWLSFWLVMAQPVLALKII